MPMNEVVGVAVTYIVIGVFGFLCNLVILIMILTVSVYHKSAYLLMANIAVGDAIQSLIVGCYVGVALLMSDGDGKGVGKKDDDLMMEYSISILSITAWFVMITTYAALGINRCVGTCFYKTKMRKFNRIRATNIMIVVIWVFSICGGVAATYPHPIIFVHPTIWTMRFVVNSTRSEGFVWFNISTNILSILVQWTCSIFVLTTVHNIQKRISNHTISSASAKRTQRQARLSFQFFYPSIVCTLSSLMFFSMPLYETMMTRWHYLVSHLVWLINHICNPFIYIYFNGRMRDTLHLWIQCKRDKGHSTVSRFHAMMSMTAYNTERRSTRELTTMATGNFSRSSRQPKGSLPQLQQFKFQLARGTRRKQQLQLRALERSFGQNSASANLNNNRNNNNDEDGDSDSTLNSPSPDAKDMMVPRYRTTNSQFSSVHGPFDHLRKMTY